VGCAGLSVHARERRAGLAKSMIAEGDWISIDGNSGEVFLGQREIVTSRPDAELAEVARWRATPALRQVG